MSELFQAGVDVTLIGLGVAFALLTILVGVVHAMSAITRLVEGGSSRPLPAATAGAAKPPMTGQQPVKGEIAGVIAVAVRMYRNRRAR